MTLSELIKEYGQPHALLDHWDKNSISYAIWGFEETMIIDSNEKCSINGDHSSLSPLDLFQETINNKIVLSEYMKHASQDNLVIINQKLDHLQLRAFDIN